MKKHRIRNPLAKRIFRELAGDWKKYLVVALFLILTIGFVSGMYVADESMLTAADEGAEKYKLEDGHFELEDKAGEELLNSIASGQKADVKAYYLAKAKTELDQKFSGEFDTEFTQRFDSEFSAEFASSFEGQIKSTLISGGADDATAEAMLPAAIEQAKQNGTYKSAYDSAYEQAYKSAYDEAYHKAYDEALAEINSEVEEKYAEAEEKYELNDPDFQPVPVTVYENFFRNENEDNNNDGTIDGSVRVYAKKGNINMACVLDGRLPETENEIAVDRMHADNVGIKVGDKITVGEKQWDVVGLIAYVNYATLHEKNTDFMFDALKFDVAMVTGQGFERLEGTVHYSYAWKYNNTPSDEKEQKALSDDFMKALLTVSVTNENELKDYLPVYANQAVHFATDDMGSDEAMGGVILDILIIIIAFIFAVTISGTITKESKTIGTLRASGYTRRELIGHYLATPVIVTFFAAAVGNALGYTLFKNFVVSMYYNSYSLPTYETMWNPTAFLKTTVIPILLMFAVNLAVICKKMRHTPLEFLRQDLKRNKRKKAVRLPNRSFFSRFRMRIILQNLPNYLILFFGIFFVCVMLAMAIGMPETLDYYKDNAKDMMFSDYQYVLTSYEDGDGNTVTTADRDAEIFGMKSLQKKSEAFSEEVSVYGIEDESKYIKIDKLKELGENEVYVSSSFAEKYGLSAGDTVSLEERYENKKYDLKVAGFYDKSLSISVFMPIESYRAVFDLGQDEFSGYLSNREITDIPEDLIATVITQSDITKMCDQLDHSMGSYMTYFQVLCILLSAVLIYLLTKIIIEKNESSISMTKILGYENGEIAKLYLLSTTVVIIIADALGVLLGSFAMETAWKMMMADYNGWFTFRLSFAGYAKMFIFVFIGYLIVLGFDFRRIKKIPLEKALKNAE